jgi:hypothetical protein
MIAGEKLRFREVRRSVFRVQFSPGMPNAAKRLPDADQARGLP